MPVVLFKELVESEDFAQFSLIGQYLDDPDEGRFVDHIAVASEEFKLGPGIRKVSVFHFSNQQVLTGSHTISQRVEAHAEIEADIIGTIALTNQQFEAINSFCEELDYRFSDPLNSPATQFKLFPHFIDDGDRIECSCAGFVHRLFQEAEVELCDMDHDDFIETDLPSLTGQIRVAGRDSFRKQFGLAGDGPWPILWPGFLFHGILHRDKTQTENYVATDLSHWEYPL